VVEVTAASDGSARPGHTRANWWTTLPDFVYPTATVIIALVVWEAASALLKVPPYLLPPPSKILAALLANAGPIVAHSWATLQEVLLGFFASILVGVPIAVAIVSSRIVEKSLYPLLVGSQVVPKIALAPLFVVWLGFDMAPKVLVVFLIAFFPIVIDSIIGLRSVEIEKLYLVQSMGANPFQAFFTIRLPQALPNIFGGLKIAITLAVVGAIVGEFIGADKGLGRLLLLANGNMDTAMLFAGIAALTIMGVLLFLVIDVLERLLLPWHVSRRMEHLTGTM
jgi:NitT/TauT family transport system permease protein